MFLGGRLLFWEEDERLKNYTKENCGISMTYSPQTGEVTIPEDGVYLIYSQVMFKSMPIYLKHMQFIF